MPIAMPLTPEDRRLARVLQVITLVMLVIMLLVPLRLSLSAMEPQFAKRLAAISTLSAFLYGCAFILSRTRYFTLGAALVALQFFTGQLLSLFARPDVKTIFGLTPWIAVSAIMCTVFLPFWFLLSFAIVQMALHLAMPFLFASLDWGSVLAQIIPLASIFAVLIAHSILRRIDAKEREDERNTLARMEKMVALGEMAAHISHEINNPLAIIEGYAAQMSRLNRKGEISPEAIDTSLDVIRATTQRIARIVRSLQTFTNEVRPNEPLIPIKIADVVNAAMELCHFRFHRANVAIEVSGSRETLCLCYPSLLTQVILNLLINALDVIKHGRDEPVCVSWQDENQYLTIKVSPAGETPGMGFTLSQSMMEKNQGSLAHVVGNPHGLFIVKVSLGS